MGVDQHGFLSKRANLLAVERSMMEFRLRSKSQNFARLTEV